VDRIKKVFEYSAIGFALVEKNGRFRYANKALSDILGYSYEELSRIDWQSITHPDDLLVDLALVAEVINGIRKGYQLEKRYIHKDGSTRYVVLSVSTFNDINGELDCFCSQITDVTPYMNLSKQIDENLKRKQDLEKFHGEILEAIASDQFILHYQKIINLKTLETVGHEALVRWQHPEKGLLYPDKFIEKCEQNPDVMLQLCQWVFKKACEDKPRLSGFLSLNVSPKSLLHTSFIEMVSKYSAIAETPIIFLEITERVFVNLEDSQILARLEDKGYGFFVDDFGQANSGLIQVIQIIKSIRLESSIKIKIDIWFTQHIHEAITYSSMKALLEMFTAMGIEAIAEGIETEAQLKAWQELGCKFGQGWLWDKGGALDRVGSF